MVQDLIHRLENNMASVIFGKKDVIRKCLITFFAGEHLLLEDFPGIGKTLISQALAKSLAVTFRRIQFTPDLIPADITGGSVYNSRTEEFHFIPGAVFTNILLADEINRTTPRTQSAMLEAMSERQISADGKTYPLPQPFMVIATENPVEFEGTYPLPESQLDRFLMRISVGYPDRQSELEILKAHQKSQPVEHLQPVLNTEQVLMVQKAVREVRIEDEIHHYILDILEATRNCSELLAGVSTRGGIVFTRAVQAAALMDGRDFVIPDDVKELAVPVLAHRVILETGGIGSTRQMTEGLIEQLLASVAVPG